MVIGVLMEPETLASWARKHGFTASNVYNALTGAGRDWGSPNRVLRERLAARLGVPVRDLNRFLDGHRVREVSVPPEDPPAWWLTGAALDHHLLADAAQPETGPTDRTGQAPPP
jgi:hypothetical protein